MDKVQSYLNRRCREHNNFDPFIKTLLIALLSATVLLSLINSCTLIGYEKERTKVREQSEKFQQRMIEKFDGPKN